MDDAQESQRDVVRFLESGEASGGLPVKRIDTHAAIVFLSGARALKIKRAVKFPFLDYSTLEKRKKACLAEIEVNRRFAPELYEGIARVTRERDGSLKIGGDGEVLEWAVQMQRFDDALTLDRYVAGHEIKPEMIETIVRRLAAVHAVAPRQEAAAWLAALARFQREHNQVFRAHPALFSPDSAESLLRLSSAKLKESTAMVRDRAAAGLLVRGHGDLHLGNIALVKGLPVIFDAVEFDPVIAAGDVLYDLAFLLMDLWINDQKPAANTALNAYFNVSAKVANVEGLGLLPLFLSMRSSVRAIVATARFDQNCKKADAEAAKNLFGHALRFIKGAEPTLVAIGGLSGTGKSVLAKRVAPQILPAPGALVLRSDALRKQLYGVRETTRLDASSYTTAASAEVYRAMLAQARRALAAGHSVVLDAVFSREHEREAAAKLAADARVPFAGIFLHTNLNERMRRVERRTGDASDADRSVVLAQETYRIGETGWAKVDSSCDPDSTLSAALAALRV